MISYRAERNICYRIFKSKHNKAPNLFIIHNNHNLSAEGSALLQGPRVPFHAHRLLQPADPSELVSTVRHAMGSASVPGRKYVKFDLSGVKILQLGQHRVLYLPRESKEENYTVGEEGGLN